MDGTEGIAYLMHDIIFYCKTQQEHDERLHATSIVRPNHRYKLHSWDKFLYFSNRSGRAKVACVGESHALCTKICVYRPYRICVVLINPEDLVGKHELDLVHQLRE